MEQARKQKIANAIKETRLKRHSQRCKVFQLKIDYSRLNCKQKESLKMFFLEAKWIYNHILRSEKPFEFDYKYDNIQAMNKDGVLEHKEIKYLATRISQTIVTILQQNIKSLSSLKKRKNKVGKLQFKSNYNSIDMPAQTYYIENNKIKILGIKKHIVINGLKQILEHYELANAKLIRKPSGYYIHITCFEFIKPEQIKKTGKEVGLDFGITNNVTTSEGETFNVSIPETERLKRLQQKIARQVKGSKNRYATRWLLQREYEKIENRKHDVANKFCNKLQTEYDVIYMQDENFKGWHSGDYGKQVQHSCMGLVKAKLLKSNKTRMIDKWYPSTKICYVCGTKNYIARSEKTYFCHNCGLTEDRDIKAAKTIKHVGQCQSTYIPMVNRDSKPVEKEPLCSKTLSLSAQALSVKQEVA
jgi:putative transposase